MDLELLSLDRIPLPSLKIYSTLSLIVASCALCYFWIESSKSSSHDIIIDNLNNISRTMEYQYQQEEVIFSASYDTFKNYYKASYSSNEQNLGLNDKTHHNPGLWANTTSDHVILLESNTPLTWQAIRWASQQPHCVWPLVNLAYCLLILLGHAVQKTVFGNLRASEQENVKDQFWNLVFYKVVFVFGVVNVQEVEDAVGWCFFVSVIGFLQLARQLCQERHNYLILMNDWTRRGETRRDRILGLLSFIFIASIILFVSVGGWYIGSSHVPNEFSDPLDFRIRYGSRIANDGPEPQTGSPYDFNLGIHSAIFMLCELGLLTIQTLHALIICIFEQVRTRCCKGREMSEDAYSNITQSINFRFDLVSLLFDLVHHVHMLICCNLFLSMTSLIVSLQMRTRVRQIHGVLKKRQSYLWLSEHIDQYPDAISPPSDSGEEDENCAICWDSLMSQKAKSLPCNHMFHSSCLRKWLLVSMNCPKCRLSLVNEKEAHYCSMERTPRRVYGPRPIGLWGFLQTGQALLDLFGGWDPQFDDVMDEAPPIPRPVPLFADFGVQDWTVQSPPETSIRREVSSAADNRKN